ncbi:MAG: hypothetical protein ACOCVR_05050 [Myxococcota bacterium]
MTLSLCWRTSRSRRLLRGAGGNAPRPSREILWAGFRLLALGLSACFATSSLAQDADLPPYESRTPVEIAPVGPFYGIRLRGLGGAYTAVAEGAEGTLTSLASLANRRPDESGYFHWSGTLSWAFPAGNLDVTNNGRSTPTGFSLLATGVALRFGALGVGFFIESMGIFDRVSMRRARANRAVVGLAYALPGDEWILGAGVHSVGYRLEQPGFQPVDTSKPHLGADLLWRPLLAKFRLGASIKSPGRAPLPAVSATRTPAAVLRPWEASMGGALWLGDGPLNLPLPNTERARPREPSRVGLLLSMDVFVVGPPPFDSGEVAGLEAYFEERLQLVRDRPSLGLRVGGETEALPDEVRLRGGFWLEPSRFAGVSPRLHWTGGFDIRLFRFFDYHVRTSLVFDMASSYRVGGISVGFW